MMQELANEVAETGLNIFPASARDAVRFIHPGPSFCSRRPGCFASGESDFGSGDLPRLGIRRKELADKLSAEAGEDLETRKTLAGIRPSVAVSEGYIIEFNDGSLDLPRVKTKKPEDNQEGAPATKAAAPAAEAELAMSAETISAPTTESAVEAAGPTPVENPIEVSETDPNRDSASPEAAAP